MKDSRHEYDVIKGYKLESAGIINLNLINEYFWTL